MKTTPAKKFLLSANGKHWEVYYNSNNDKMAEAIAIATNVYYCHGEVTLADCETGQILILIQHPF